MNYAPLETIISELAQGNFVIVIDEHREKEGDFLVLAQDTTPEKVNFMLTHGKGLICVACHEDIISKLELPLLTQKNESMHHTNFCLTIDASEGITTGVSASDRAKTIQILGNENATCLNIVSPGHTFPLLAKSVSERFGHTEAAVELAKRTGKTPACTICEILNEEGAKASIDELKTLAQKYNIVMTTLEELKKEFLED
jgi:3,4-dihydroxy 2-butanone 4-phosphate synthase / GTP cyclohydrolase II